MNRFFFIAWGLSLVVHAVVMFTIPSRKSDFSESNVEPISMVYQHLELASSPPLPADIQSSRAVQMKDPLPEIELLDKEMFRREDLFQHDSDIPKFSKRSGFERKQTMPVMDSFDHDRKIMIPELTMEKVSNPQYFTYTEAVRNAIRSRAYDYIDAPDLQNGDVYMTFVIGQSGQLKAIRVVEERSRANEFLRRVGVRSIEASDPFPSFPQGLNFQELTFNIKISFQVN
jgi:hypothetical protein